MLLSCDEIASAQEQAAKVLLAQHDASDKADDEVLNAALLRLDKARRAHALLLERLRGAEVRVEAGAGPGGRLNPSRANPSRASGRK